MTADVGMAEVERVKHASCLLMPDRLEACPTLRRVAQFWLGLFCVLLPVFGQTVSSTPPTALSATLKDLARYEQGLPFRDVLRATTGHDLIPFDTNNASHLKLRDAILKAASAAGERARKEGLPAARANEAGNHIEAFVKAALKDAALDARTPVNSEGDAQAVGYPDVEILGDTPCYLELKTYSAATASTTQRSFYYSPSERPKVIREALHLLLAFQMERTERDGQTIFLPVHWKLITLENLEVELKAEFNQSNRGLYSAGAGKAVLSEGPVK